MRTRAAGCTGSVVKWAIATSTAPTARARADKILPLAEGGLADAVGNVCDFLEITDRDSRASILALAKRMEG